MPAPVVLLRVPRRPGWRIFSDPARVIVARRPEEVVPCLAAVERAVVRERCWAAGFVAYEAAAGFGLPVRAPDGALELPLAWFGVFPASRVSLRDRAAGTSCSTGSWHPSIDRDEYAAAVATIKDRIAAGDTYQINFTFRLTATFEGDPLALLADLDEAQRGAWGGFVDIGSHAICSASPELFFLKEGTRIECRPMKGTAPRGLSSSDDRRRARALQASAKNRAENVMVVDMTRSDLGRIARTGSVHVSSLFDVERYPGQWQMTSTVVADTPAATLPGMFDALFPSGSVTGAPRRSSMDIIRRLESRPRGVYTGAIGCVSPEGLAYFNVAIRTVTIDLRAGVAEFGVGSGIVWDSVAGDEFDECVNKAAMLTRRDEPFDLIETMRWRHDGGIARLARHLERLRTSAEYFGFAYPGDDFVRARIDRVLGDRPDRTDAVKVRLVLSADGGVDCRWSAIEPLREPVRLAIAPGPVQASDRFLYHKTSRRTIYERARASRPEADSVLLWNDGGEITEATEANVVLELDGTRVTPQLDCGLLPGTLRAELLESGEIEEAVVPLDHLQRATRVWLINSVRGWMQAEVVV